MFRISALAAAASLVLAPAGGAWGQGLSVVSDAPAATPGASHFVLHSDRLGRDFDVRVETPFATAFLPGQTFPTIYALDAGYDIAGPQARLLGGAQAMAPAIVVSVGYRPGEAENRNTDLLHNKTAMLDEATVAGGGGAAFQSFLSDDLKPFIQARFPSDPRRTVLFGHSFGGLFAANVFASDPGAFAAYVIGSPSVWADPGVVERVAAAAAGAAGERVYLSVGEAEDRATTSRRARMREGFEGLAAALRGHPGITLRTQVYAGETHISYYPRLVFDAFPFVLPPVQPRDAAAVPLSADEAARYAGVYDMPDGRKITVRSGPVGTLTGQVTGIPAVPLIPLGPNHFYAPTSDLDVVFDPTGVTMSGGGGRLRIPREAGP
jgi:predicted alpha/beta superfamily hydrolase